MHSFTFLILPGVLSVAFNQQHEPFSVLVFAHLSDEVMPKSQEGRPRTANVTRKIRTEKEDDWTWISKRVAVRIMLAWLAYNEEEGEMFCKLCRLSKYS